MIRDHLALKLGLRSTGTKTLCLVTLASSTPVVYEGQRYVLEIKLVDGSYKSVVLYSKPTLVGKIIAVTVRPVSNTPLSEQAWELSYYDADPGILLGIDCFFDLDIRRMTKLVTGAYILNSSLGYLAAGRVKRSGSWSLYWGYFFHNDAHRCLPYGS